MHLWDLDTRLVSCVGNSCQLGHVCSILTFCSPLRFLETWQNCIGDHIYKSIRICTECEQATIRAKLPVVLFETQLRQITVCCEPNFLGIIETLLGTVQVIIYWKGKYAADGSLQQLQAEFELKSGSLVLLYYVPRFVLTPWMKPRSGATCAKNSDLKVIIWNTTSIPILRLRALENLWYQRRG